MSLAIPGTVAASTSMGAIVPITRFVGGTSEVVSFTNIPTIYNHLYLTVSGLYTTGNGSLAMDNLPASNVCSQTYLSGTGNNSVATTTRSSGSNFLINVPVAAPLSNPYPHVSEIYILNYASNTQFKPVLIKHGNDKNSPSQTQIAVGNFNSTTPITFFNLSTTIFGVYMSPNTTFSLYGIRGFDPK